MNPLMNNMIRLPLEIVGGEGVKLIGADGVKYFDLFNDSGTASLGYTKPIEEMAKFVQSGKPHRVPNLFTSKPRTSTAARLCEVFKMDSLYFSNSGTESVEAAIKLVRKYWAGRQYPGSRKLILTLPDQFHGCTGFSMGLSDSSKCLYHKKHMGPWPEQFGVWDLEYLRDPIYAHFKCWDESLQDYKYSKTEWKNVAAILFSPVLCANVVRPYDQALFKVLDNIRYDKGVKIIFDEVQTGMGRCGEYAAFMSPEIGVVPDVLCLGKGVALGFPCGVTLARGEVARAFEPGNHNSTMGGHLLSLHMIDALLDWLAVNLPHIRDMESRIAARFTSRSHFMFETSGMGLLWEFSLPHKIPHKLFCEKARENNILMMVFRDTSPLKIAPPLNITLPEIDEVFRLLDKTYTAAVQEVK